MDMITNNLVSPGQYSTRRLSQNMNGVLLIDKPSGITSHDVLQALRRILGIKKLGHTGTLDPLASGLLVFCVGTTSKLARFLVSKDKSYEAEIRLGLTTETYDSEGLADRLESDSIPQIGLSEVEKALQLFRGNIQQRAPKYSAIKIKGSALYKSARKGEPCYPPLRPVVIHSIEIRNYQPPFLRLAVVCGKGTYIRSLAHDIGAELGPGAYLSSLRRTRVGELRLEDAHTLEKVQRLVDTGSLSTALLAAESVIDLPALIVTENFAARVRHGVSPGRGDITRAQGEFCAGDHVSLKNSAGHILAVGISEIAAEELADRQGGGIFRYERVL